MTKVDKCPFCGSPDIWWGQEAWVRSCKSCGRDFNIKESEGEDNKDEEE